MQTVKDLITELELLNCPTASVHVDGDKITFVEGGLAGGVNLKTDHECPTDREDELEEAQGEVKSLEDYIDDLERWVRKAEKFLAENGLAPELIADCPVI